jgi:hypothetical protein
LIPLTVGGISANSCLPDRYPFSSPPVVASECA